MNDEVMAHDLPPDDLLHCDLLLSGTVYFDMIFSGFPHPPTPGQEVFTDGMGSAPGGIANLAVAASRLGVNTSLVAGFGDDLYAEWMWQVLRDQEDIDLRFSQRHPGQHTPVTVSLAMNDDRSLITHAHPWPALADDALPDSIAPRAVIVDLGDPALRAAQWWRRAREQGALVLADAGWDPSGAWDHRILHALREIDVFTPNASEAMAYTGTSDPRSAAEALLEFVPLAVVTLGGNGVLAASREAGQIVEVPAIPTTVVDATGAGDVFAAGLVTGLLRDWELEQALRFASLCGALAVQQHGGSLAAPGWGDIADWWRTHRSDPAFAAFEFLDHALVGADTRVMRRAEATIARFSDA